MRLSERSGPVRSRQLLLVLFLGLLLVPSQLQAEDLARRSYLGLEFDLSDRRGPGLLVQRVLPGSTAASAGIRAGDRLTSVGRIDTIEEFAELRPELARTPVGERIPLRFYRGRNRAIRVSPPLKPLPTEQVPGSLVRYDAVFVDGIGQRLIVSEPVGGARGLVFYLSGLDCTSHDFWHETHTPIKRLVDGWAGAGYATARLEKRGEGDSAGPACAEFSFEDERRGYLAAIAHLARRGYRDRIVLFGHGLGGIIAPLVALDAVAGVMVYGTVSEPWFDHTMSSFERQDTLAGLGLGLGLGLGRGSIERRLALRSEFQTGLLFAGETPGELIARIPGAAALPEVQPEDPVHFRGRSVAFFVELGAVDPVRFWRRVWQPVLALHGQYDWVSAREDHERIARLSGGKFQSLARLDHGFLSYESLEDSFSAAGTGRFDPAVIDATLSWLKTLSLPETVIVADGGRHTDI